MKTTFVINPHLKKILELGWPVDIKGYNEKGEWVSSITLVNGIWIEWLLGSEF
jgi:hypothetical protein